MSFNLSKRVQKKKIIVLIGSGGVGKTTVSAAIGLYLARQGVKTLVITMDPARRLASALGIKSMGNEEVKVERNLYCMQLDSKHAFDEMMVKYLKNRPGFGEEKVQELLSNRFYQGLSDAFIGTQEYIASGKLYGLIEEGTYETVVVDTPPSKHSIDFIKAPNRLLDALDSQVVRLVVRPYGVLQRAANAVLRSASSITGSTFLKAFSSFFSILDISVYEDFRDRVLTIHRRMLDKEQSIFFIVASPKFSSLREALKMNATLDELDLPLGGVVVNRVHNDPLADIRPAFDAFRERKDVQQGFSALLGKYVPGISPEVSSEFVSGLMQFVESLSDEARLEAKEIQKLEREKIPYLLLPAQSHSICDVEGLSGLIPYFEKGE